MPKPILITGLVPGYPSKKLTLDIAQECLNDGADILELSASFSEPVADGPTLQLAHQRVLASGFSKSDAFVLYQEIKTKTKAPLFLIEYANIIYKIGFDDYYQKAVRAGINYLAVPDVPLEESKNFVRAAKRYGLAQIFLIAPTTPDDRVKKIIKVAKTCTFLGGSRSAKKQFISRPVDSLDLPTFLYLVSITGVTGSRKKVSPDTINFIKRVRRLTDLPLIVGFGISEPQHIKAVITAGASGVITCSAIVDIIHNLQNQPSKMISTITNFVQSLKYC